jgi:F-type H+-transporting ATPase subunit c
MTIANFFGAVLRAFLAVDGMVAVGAGIAALTGVGAAIAMGLMVSKSVESIARQPEAAGQIRMNMMIGLAFAETTALFGLVVGILLIFM